VHGKRSKRSSVRGLPISRRKHHNMVTFNERCFFLEKESSNRQHRCRCCGLPDMEAVESLKQNYKIRLECTQHRPTGTVPYRAFCSLVVARKERQLYKTDVVLCSNIHMTRGGAVSINMFPNTKKFADAVCDWEDLLEPYRPSHAVPCLETYDLPSRASGVVTVKQHRFHLPSAIALSLEENQGPKRLCVYCFQGIHTSNSRRATTAVEHAGQARGNNLYCPQQCRIKDSSSSSTSVIGSIPMVRCCTTALHKYLVLSSPCCCAQFNGHH
jgi:hypothetical protein